MFDVQKNSSISYDAEFIRHKMEIPILLNYHTKKQFFLSSEKLQQFPMKYYKLKFRTLDFYQYQDGKG